MKRQHSTLIAIATLLCVTVTTNAPAQVEDRDNGFYLGLRLGTSHLPIDKNSDDTFRIDADGGGLGLLAGYSFNRVFSLELDLSGGAHRTSVFDVDATFGALRVWAHYRFRPGQAFRPYMKGGLGAYGFGIQDKSDRVTITGGGVPLGIGFDYFFNPRFSLGLDVIYNVIEYNKFNVELGSSSVSFDIDADSAQSSLSLAFQFYF